MKISEVKKRFRESYFIQDSNTDLLSQILQRIELSYEVPTPYQQKELYRRFSFRRIVYVLLAVLSALSGLMLYRELQRDKNPEKGAITRITDVKVIRKK